MAGTTRAQLCEQIRRMLAGGHPNDDFQVTVGLVNQNLNAAIAAAAVKNKRENSDLEGVDYVADAFYSRFKGIAITKEADTGYYTAKLPQPPVAVGIGYDITSFKLFSRAGVKTSCIRVPLKELDYMHDLDLDLKKVYYWVNGDNVFLQSNVDITGYKITLQMVSSQSSDLSSVLSVPDNYIPDIVSYMAGIFNIQTNVPVDVANDGINTNQIK